METNGILGINKCGMMIHLRVPKDVAFLKIHMKLLMAILIVPFQNIKFKYIFIIQNTLCLHEWFGMTFIFANIDKSNHVLLK